MPQTLAPDDEQRSGRPSARLLVLRKSERAARQIRARTCERDHQTRRKVIVVTTTLARKGCLMSISIEGRAEELLKGKNFCHVATLRADGSVHGVPVWVDVQDGRPVVNTVATRAWPRNLERDPRVTLTVPNMENPYEYLEVRGREAERTQEGADAHIDSLAKKYLGVDTYPYRQPGEQRIIIRVEPDHARVIGQATE